MDQFMERAVELAVENVRNGGEPFGAVLVKNNKQVAEGVNELHKRFDITAHAEIQAMRRAQKMMHSHELKGYTMYASGEPCPMCLTAMYYAGLDTIYYCNASEDAVEAGLGKAKSIYAELQKPKSERHMEMVHMPLKDGQEDPMQLWQERT
ncbi:tRNA-specific adenosine deaminase [Lentibacillus kapialis]|uniref:tRNA-specific adenosine deaminase n=1 Tax=Lentibacillus kapialis TaxID=340214 RepID=A0A917Q2G1_9BACI|nr:nucleoside deaminase [Lentibacillus kapialis]GGK07816.1 tRNA-specific adenosine deaminase [Lentibacillus kapialis]